MNVINILFDGVQFSVGRVLLFGFERTHKRGMSLENLEADFGSERGV